MGKQIFSYKLLVLNFLDTIFWSMKKSEKIYPPSFINNNNLGQTLWLILQIFSRFSFWCLFVLQYIRKQGNNSETQEYD